MRMRLIDDEQLVPSMVDAAVVNTVSKTVDRNGGGTAKLHFTITGVDSKKEMLTIDRENMYYSNDALLKNLDAELTEAVTILMQNKFEPVQIYGINVEAEVSNAVQVAEILNVRTKNAKVKPGDKVAIDVTMKPYRGEDLPKQFISRCLRIIQAASWRLTCAAAAAWHGLSNCCASSSPRVFPLPRKRKHATSLAIISRA